MAGINRWVQAAAFTLAVAATAIGCGGSSSPTAPSGGSGGSGSGGGGTGSGGSGGGSGGSVNTTTMTINASGVLTPNDITVAVGSRVTIINSHNRAHEMSSDNHPDHNECPALNDIGFLSPGQQKASGNLTVVRTCGVHDHNDANNQNLKGTIRIQ